MSAPAALSAVQLLGHFVATIGFAMVAGMSAASIIDQLTRPRVIHRPWRIIP